MEECPDVVYEGERTNVTGFYGLAQAMRDAGGSFAELADTFQRFIDGMQELHGDHILSQTETE